MSRPPIHDSEGFPATNHSQWSASPAPHSTRVRPLAGASPRAPQRRSLTDDAHVWLARLPPRYQPLATARLHPHIVNELASIWAMPAALPAYFEELLFSRRSGRQGFSFDVLTELADLQTLAAGDARGH